MVSESIQQPVTETTMRLLTRICTVLILSIGLFSCAWLSPDGTVIEQPSIANNSFEIAHTNWAADWIEKALYVDGRTSCSLDQDVAHTGRRSILVVNIEENDAQVIQDVAVLPDTIYHITCWIRASNITGAAGANLSVLDSGAHSEFVFDTGGQWRLVELYGMTGHYQKKIKVTARIGIWGTTVTGKAYFDDFSIRIAKSIPAGFSVQPLTFNEDYTEERGKAFFARIQDERLVSNRLSMSILIALVMFVAFALFTVYVLFVKGRWPKADRLIANLPAVWKYVLIWSSFIVFYVLFVLRSGFGVLTAFDIQVTFGLFTLVAVGIAGYLLKTGELTKERLVFLVIFIGISVRLCYFLYTPYIDEYSRRQHDVWGAWSHVEYIKYLAEHFTLPPVGLNETYHPPVHYILAAVVYKIATVFGASDSLAFQAVQVHLAFLSSLVVIFADRIFKSIGCDANARLFGVAVMSFLPSLVIMSATLTNDVTVSFFFTLGLYLLIRWVNDSSVKNTILLAFACALSVLSKKSAFIIFVISGIVFFVELYRHRHEARKYVKLALVFLAISIPLGASYQVRNYVLFQQGPEYTVPFTNTSLSNNPYHLVGVPVDELLESPFVPPDDAKRKFLIGELVRSALFETFMRDSDYGFSLPGIDDIAVLLMLLFLVNLVFLFLYLVSGWKNNYTGNRYIMLACFLLSILAFIQMRLSSGYLMVCDFRYLAPFMSVPLAYFLAHANTKLAGSKIRLFKYLIPVQFALWCATSIMFFLLVGF